MRPANGFGLAAVVLAAAVSCARAAGDGDGPSAPPSDVPGVSCDTTKANAGHRMLRRLTNFEYDNTVRDLVGVPSTYGAQFPPDDVVNGFDDIAATQHVASLYTGKARSAAEDIAAKITLTSIVPCAVASGDAACASSFVSSFGLRAFRRPLTDAEKERYAKLHGAVAATDGFEGGVRAVITAMIQSPNFLYRTELGTPDADGYTLTPYEIASELSYMFTGSMPDDALMADAASGALSSRDVIAQHAKRLLASDKSRALLDHFATQWLSLDRLDQAVKDSASYPLFTPELRTAMRDETLSFVTNLTRTPGSTFTDLVVGETTWASDALATFYGLGAPIGEADARGLKPYHVAPGRVGVLAQASILSAQGKPTRSDPVHRGKLVRERFFCQTLPPPPPINANVPAVSETGTTRDKVSQHASDPACNVCHKLMDPIGFGFEGFDGIGRPQTEDTSGAIIGSPGSDSTFNGVPELAKHLAASKDAQACFALEWYRFAYGLDEMKDDSCGAPLVAGTFLAKGLALDELLIALTQTDHFVRRAPDGTPSNGETDAGGGGTVQGGDAGVPGTQDASGGTDANVTPPPPPGIEISRKNDSTWPTGYCDSVTVKNNGTAAVDWTATIAADGKLNHFWNANETTSGQNWVFTGVDFNRTIAPTGTASFGFCVDK